MNENTALILIDFQKGFDDLAYWGNSRNNPGAEANAGRLLNRWRAKGMSVIHIQHCSTNFHSPLFPSKTGNQFKELVKPVSGEPVIQKSVNSAFIGTNLKELLEERQIKNLIVTGLTTDHCVSTTVRMASNYGYQMYLVADATATFDRMGPDGKVYQAELVHQMALASLHKEFATILTMGELLRLSSCALYF